MLFARKIEFKIKAGQDKEFHKVFETKVMPILKKQVGFQDELLLKHEHKMTAISLWDTRQHAQGYEKIDQAKVFETLEPFFEAKPKVEEFEVPFATMHAHV